MAAQSRAIPVLLTRPVEQGARFAAELRDRFGDNVEVIESPVLATQFLQPSLLERPWSSVIFTSATAVTAAALLGDPAQALPRKAYCVGDRTAAAATAMGFSAVSANGNADRLCEVIEDGGETGPLLHLRGRDAIGSLAERLGLAGIETHEAIIYAELPQPLSTKARAILQTDHPVILPVFSPRTGRILAQELKDITGLAPLLTVAISPAAAGPLDEVPAMCRFVADHPDAPAMLLAIGRALIAAQAA